ncbi:MAG: type II toxin-antitoxin system VapC family toxin [Solirubrobacteraceae bacterium]
MPDVLLDTDVLIDHMRGRRHLVTDKTAVSVVTRSELFAGDERHEAAVDELLEDCEEIEVSPEIARRAGRIKRQTGLQIADAMIAATALEHGLPLMTRNRRHFERVAGLELRTPTEPAKQP